ncbi:DUF805 domain-containing protein [Sinorhizobium sp. BG8]|uniref:DUF805 domain-containing protein n=1 Tax=Sinorhizobium sp. BG8 TaxID=2613773 RepID=UPI00193E40B2|nr:DUF805 domain-containing protein [Sinorhizobium sp. BG8]QRM54047.1 DUF805 domain-containing protein [Sinorhizobium sp. BG8]
MPAAAEQIPSLTWLFFGWSGRLARVPYALAWAFWVVILSAVLTRMIFTQHQDPSFTIWTVLFLLVGLVASVSSVMLTIKRLHDMNVPAPLVLCLFVPAISFFALIAFVFWPGTAGPNSHGIATNRPKN